MFLGRMIRRRLLSLLGTRLMEPPELELKIGIIHSHVIAKNLRFDASVLNALLDDSSNVSFKELTIENLTLNVSPEHGLHDKMLMLNLLLEDFRENDHGGTSSPVDSTYADLEKELNAMDPEGRALHEVLRKLCVAMPSSDKSRISIWNLIFRHCQLVVHDIKVHLQLPMANDCILGFWEVEELAIVSQYLEQSCILRDFLGMIFAPIRESSFLVSWNDFEIGFRRNDQMTRVFFCKDLLSSSKLKDLQFVDANLHIPELRILFSPTDMVVCLAFQKALSRKVKHPRSGKQLWKVVARRISTVSSVTRFSLHRVVTETTLWLRYVNSYEHLLSLVGYPSSNLLKKSALRILEDKSFISLVRHQWKLISDIEKELKADAILQGRRIARNRLSRDVHVPVGGSQYFFSHHLLVLYKFLASLRFLAKLVYGVFYFVLHFGSLGRVGTQGHQTDGSSDLTPKERFLENSFILYFENVSITLLPNKEICLHSAFQQFSVKFGSLSLKYVDNIFEQSLFTSCAKFGVSSTLICSDAVTGKETTSATLTEEGLRIGDSTGLETLVWGEPVEKYSSLANKESEVPPDLAVGVAQSYLQKFLRDFWIDWEATRQEELNSSLIENPFILFEMSSCLSYPGTRILDPAPCRCNLMVGRLHVALGYFSTLSISVLLVQILHAFSLRKDVAKSSSTDNASSSIDNPMIDSKAKLGSYFDRMKIDLLEMLPEKNIQFGVFISGPRVRISFEKDGLDYSKTVMDYDQSHNIQLKFDVHDIELAIWPAIELGLDPPTRSEEHEDVEKPRTHDISTEIDGKYTFEMLLSLGLYLRARGIDAYVENLTEKQQTQILSLSPIVFQLSIYRKYVHSLSGTYVILSTALNGIASGCMAQLYMDAIYVISQEIQGLSTAVFVNTAMVGSECLKESLLQYLEVVDPVKENIMLKGPILLDKSTFLMKVAFRIYPMDLVFQYSVNNNDMSNIMKKIDTIKLDKHNVFDCGIWVSIKDVSVDISSGEETPNVLICIAQAQLAIIKGTKRRSINLLNKMLLQSLSCCYEASVPNTTFAMYCNSPVGIMTNGHNVSACNPSTSNDPHKSSAQSSSRKNLPVTVAPCASQWLHINIAVGQIVIARHSVTELLLGAHETRELLLSLSVGGEFQIISSRIQGGLLMVETEALVMFLGSYTCLLQYANKLLHTFRSSNQMRKDGSAAESITLNDNFSEINVQDMPSLSNQTSWGRLELLTFDTSTFSIMVAAEEEPGVVRQIMLELHIKLNLELGNTRKKFQFDLSRVSVTSQVLSMSMDQQVQNPHFASMTTSGLRGSLSKSYEDRSGSFENENNVTHMSEDTSTITVIRTGQQKFILNNGGGSVQGYTIYDGHTSLDGPWIGDGSFSGFDMTISLPEIQMILSAIGSFSLVSTKENSSKEQSKEQRHWDSNQQVDYIKHNFEEIVPDGAIVAIQDVDQHMFFTVDGGGRDTYSVVGVLHYSLVGERAFFQVRYHKEIGWRSSISWFSLISLHARNESGEPLRLTYRRGRGSVEVFSSYDNRSSLFRAVSWKPGNFEGDIGWEPYNHLVKSTFYLVNKKNSCALAFVNGVPTFVKKPGNPFKFRVFQDTYLPHNLSIENGFVVETSRAENQYERQTEERSQQQQGHCFPLIKIKAEKVSVTVVHERLDEQDRVPLLNFGIADILLNVQVLPDKIRMICTLQAWLDYFDSQRKSWRHLIHPVEIYSYYRNRLSVCTDIVKQGAPSCFYCRSKEVDVSLNEISLDIPLFVVGKLNIAGPYSVRSTMILSNCCKVENQSRADLLCQFDEKQSVKIAGGQCVSVHIRHQFVTDQLSKPPPTVSVQLAFLESFTMSQIQLSLSETQVVTWKTRIVSNDGSKTFPGPFIVIDITRKSEDGLSIVVSPLIRVHNETKFSMELRFQRPQQAGDEFVISLKKGETLDDSMAMLEAISLFGGLKKAITSLAVGNFLLSFRPEIPESSSDDASSSSVDWSDDIKGGKAVYLSGVLDKLNYKVRKALSSESTKISFTTACCTIGNINSLLGELHFLIKSCTRGVPIKQPDNPRGNEAAVALQEQKEIFLLPTFRVFNFLQSEIHVFLTDTDCVTVIEQHTIGNQATISCGSAADFYVNPAKVLFNVTLTAYQFSCKPLNSTDWVRSLLKRKKETGSFDVDLDFDGKCFASLRLSRGSDGILEAFIFTPYTLKNETGILLFVCQPNQKLPVRDETDKTDANISPDIGVLLPPNSSQSWFLKSNKVQVKMLETDLCETLLELDSLSGLSEIRLETEDKRKVRCFTKFGIAVGPAFSKLDVPARLVTMVPRFVVLNNSEENIIARQCYLEDDMTGMLTIKSKKREMLMLREISRETEFSLFESFIRKHRNTSEDSTIYIQFQSNNSDWSGPICVASLGCFFLKFRKKQSNELQVSSKIATEYANVHVAEEGPSLVMSFYKPPVVKLPYRIENRLHDALITYYQKDSSEPEVLQPQHSTDYVWDDLTLPHKLVIQISDIHQLHEINLDKVREWKSFFKSQRYEGLSSQVLTKRKSVNKRNNMAGFEDIMKVGYEVYADGPTRVLCISEASAGHKEDKISRACGNIRIRVPGLAIHMNELKEVDEGEPLVDTPFLISRLAHVNVDALFTDQQNYCNLSVQSLDIVPKWAGAPFAAMVRRHHSESDDSSVCILKILIVLRSSSSNVTQVQYSSIVLQPIDLNLDEETLMKIVPFWRTSLSESSTPSRQFYFDHFEIHPIKIVTNFVPGDSYSSYSSAQETLRSFIHSVVKIPPIKNMVVELNGVLVTHALVTMRELSIKCAQHYTWYAMRAIYIAKGSPLLPPGFASIFDDLASSSLDVFFDPSKALMKLPGLTLGTFKLISKSIGGKDFSGTKRYFGDLEKTLRTAGSNVMFAAVTEVSDSVLRGAEASGFDGMIRGFHQGILKLAMEPSVLGSALLEGGPDRVIQLDESPGMDELYIEGYLQAMLDAVFKQEYLTVRVVDNQVFLKNLPPSSTLMEEIMDRVKGVLISRGLLKGDPLAASRPLRHLRGDNTEWRIGPTVLTLCEHLVVSFAIRMLRNQASKATSKIKRKVTSDGDDEKNEGELSVRRTKLGGFIWRWGIGKFLLSGLVAYVDGRLCRHIPHPMARRIVSGFLLSFLDKDDTK